MPRIIRRALFEKMAALPEWLGFREDFFVATGLRLILVDDLGVRTTCESYLSPICRAMEADPGGRRYCERLRQTVLAGAGGGSSVEICDAGLIEAAVPLRISGMQVGHLLFLGFRHHPAAKSERKRARHLLAKAGVTLPGELLDSGLAAAPRVPERKMQAYLRFVEMAARQIAETLTAHLAMPGAPLPALVRRACALIQREALVADISLAAVAQRCHVSAGHLSRLFHQSTGLTFREYLARHRVAHAHDLVLHTDKPVTEICFESGFQSLSQFNRAYRRVHGKAPRDTRRECRERARRDT